MTLPRDWGSREDLADLAEEFADVADDVFRAAILRVRRAPEAPSNLVGAIWAAVNVERRDRQEAQRLAHADRALADPADRVDPEKVSELVREFMEASNPAMSNAGEQR